MSMMIAGRASNYGVLCGRYIVASGAFADLVRRGTRPKMLCNHEGPEIGEWMTISDDERGLFVTGRLWDNPGAIEAIELFNDGCLTGLSLGPKGAAWDMMRCGIKILTEVTRIDEISLVGQPHDPAALITEFAIGAGQ
ncbi:HK97 family phage prohead protease [Mesorhizobium mediterraneum]|uniref:Prohead serine protease domain-containing protein n=1 Tax=Mesorhizobium mediterraneum TaxID=43617 RepID=A0AB36RAC3_9HYPH|nr:HK97 family phage prohead protease [Mesorhizobium mediterraneum]PAQ01558.1 hypothetical protein CIT25_16105 [Mesorhizobium mediterraneum]WIW51145.1 HK97 family phage prohead protease [Mesorhizobium mediterraneum]